MAKRSAFIESPSVMEPLMPMESDAEIEDLVANLIQKSSTLTSAVNPILSRSIGDLIRSMNCYYSNFLEGHNTHPKDIERALKNEYSTDNKKRDLQKEAVAHIKVQNKIDQGECPYNICSSDAIKWIHQEFYKELPEDFLWVTNPDTNQKIKVKAGCFREGDVKVGLHIPPHSDFLDDFLNRFCSVYNPEKLSKIKQVIAVAASHHRLLWIHPFYDGNGRVTRLFSHAYLKNIGIGNSLWSISRGLARASDKYKNSLAMADDPRRGDLDGRGNLTHQGLVDFCKFFLGICIDQVEYMASILEPSDLLRRVEIYTQNEIAAGKMLKGSYTLLREAILMGEFERGRAESITGYKDRQARTVMSNLIERQLLVSSTVKGTVRLGLPLEVVEFWFPKLYPNQ